MGRVKEKWQELTLEYVKSKNPQSAAANLEQQQTSALSFVTKKIRDAEKLMPDRAHLLSTAKKLAERRKCDVLQLLKFCHGFVDSMKHNQGDFAEQKSCLVDDKAVAARMKQQYSQM